jgi:hypothetical protein
LKANYFSQLISTRKANKWTWSEKSIKRQ